MVASGAVLSTISLNAGELMTVPVESVTWTAIVCVPSRRAVVFHGSAYGEEVTGAPEAAPSTRSTALYGPVPPLMLGTTFVVPTPKERSGGCAIVTVSGAMPTLKA